MMPLRSTTVAVRLSHIEWAISVTAVLLWESGCVAGDTNAPTPTPTLWPFQGDAAALAPGQQSFINNLKATTQRCASAYGNSVGEYLSYDFEDPVYHRLPYPHDSVQFIESDYSQVFIYHDQSINKAYVTFRGTTGALDLYDGAKFLPTAVNLCTNYRHVGGDWFRDREPRDDPYIQTEDRLGLASGMGGAPGCRSFLDTFLQSVDGKVEIHRGYWAAEQTVEFTLYLRLRNLTQDYPGLTVQVEGHSEGGALAQIFATRLALSAMFNPANSFEGFAAPRDDINVMTLAQPTVGNGGFSAVMDQWLTGRRNIRIVNRCDDIPNLFPGQRQVGQEVWYPQLLHGHQYYDDTCQARSNQCSAQCLSRLNRRCWWSYNPRCKNVIPAHYMTDYMSQANSLMGPLPRRLRREVLADNQTVPYISDHIGSAALASILSPEQNVSCTGTALAGLREDFHACPELPAVPKVWTRLAKCLANTDVIGGDTIRHSRSITSQATIVTTDAVTTVSALRLQLPTNWSYVASGLISVGVHIYPIKQGLANTLNSMLVLPLAAKIETMDDDVNRSVWIEAAGIGGDDEPCAFMTVDMVVQVTHQGLSEATGPTGSAAFANQIVSWISDGLIDFPMGYNSTLPSVVDVGHLVRRYAAVEALLCLDNTIQLNESEPTAYNYSGPSLDCSENAGPGPSVEHGADPLSGLEIAGIVCGVIFFVVIVVVVILRWHKRRKDKKVTRLTKELKMTNTTSNRYRASALAETAA